jgi:hypothetical protein
MSSYIAPLIFLAVLFIGFGLVHRNGQNARGCAGGRCSGKCENKSECRNEKPGLSH